MARKKGLFSFPANFEVKYAEPIDARMVVGELSDLTSPAQWASSDGTVYAYQGMIVTVIGGAFPETRGLFWLDGEDYQIASNWRKVSIDPLPLGVPENAAYTDDDLVMAAEDIVIVGDELPEYGEPEITLEIITVSATNTITLTHEPINKLAGIHNFATARYYDTSGVWYDIELVDIGNKKVFGLSTEENLEGIEMRVQYTYKPIINEVGAE